MKTDLIGLYTLETMYEKRICEALHFIQKVDSDSINRIQGGKCHSEPFKWMRIPANV